MNIALFDATPHWSGGSKRVFLLAGGLKKLGHNVFVVCLPDGVLSEKCSQNGIRYINIKPLNDVDPMAFVKIYSFLRKEKIDIADFNSPRFYWTGVYAGRIAGARTVITRNVPFRKKGLKRKLNRKFLYAAADCVVAISETINRELYEDFGIKNLVTIYDGIPLEIAAGDAAGARQRLGITGSPVAGIFGRISPGKGHAYLLEAVKKVNAAYPGINLVIVGAGDAVFTGFLKRKSVELGLEKNVIFTGFRENVEEYYAAVDFTVAPTLDEGLGMNILEACAAGKPVVASNTGGVPEIISEGENGFLVKPADSDALAEGILKLLEQDLSRLGRRGREIAAEKFSADKMVSEYERLYVSLL